MAFNRQFKLSPLLYYVLGVPMVGIDKTSNWHGKARLSRAFPCQLLVLGQSISGGAVVLW